MEILQKPFVAADILLPSEIVNFTLWPTLACDQFTSQPEYWQKAEALTAGMPSTLHITLPEIYLERPDTNAHIAAIHEIMRVYRDVMFTRAVHGFVYVERTTPSGVRQGLVGAVDLEAYSYAPGAAPPVRPSEHTVPERIPPRLAVRRGAALETPHIMMLIDDAARAVVEPFAAKKEALRPLYDTDLMLGGGHIAGWAVTDAQDIAAIESAVAALGTQPVFDAKYPEAAGRPPLAVAVGDGNHSLATAKAYWEELKPTLPPEMRETHPARWCLAELVNVHSPALLIEPIHRVVFGIPAAELAEAFCVFTAAHGAVRCENAAEAPAPGPDEPHGATAGTKAANTSVSVTAVPRSTTTAENTSNAPAPGPAAPTGAAECDPPATTPCQTFRFVGPDGEQTISIQNAPWPLAVGTADAFLTAFTAQHPNARVDYIHGEEHVRALAGPDTAGLLLPDFAKSDLFRGVALGGVLPKKTFSMGHAEEKRYYLECRAIAANASPLV